MSETAEKRGPGRPKKAPPPSNPAFMASKPMSVALKPGAWGPAKVEAFKKQFMKFLNYVKIDSKETGGNTVLGQNIYGAQLRYLSAVWDALSNDVHDVKTLKSRQLGITTISMPLYMFWLGMFDGTQGAMIFDTGPHMAGTRRLFKRIVENLPPELDFPTIVHDNREGLGLSNGSFTYFMAAGVRNSRSSGVLGRSSGLSVLHCSEMCSWENDEGVTSLTSSVAKTNPNRLYLWESTARGEGLWKDMWDEAKADDLNQATVFIGWWANSEQRIQRGTAAYERYGLPSVSEAEQQRIDEVYERYGHQVDDEQLAWIRRMANPTGGKDDGEETDFEADELLQQDQPWTEDEAFVMTGSSFFPAENLTKFCNLTVSPDYESYTFNPSTDFTNCTYSKSRGKRFTQLKVWREPEHEGVYVVSADPAFGHDEDNDRSSVQVLRCYADCVEQVAEYACATTATTHFAWVIMSLLGWYKNARLILEINGPGEAVWNELKLLKQILTQGYLKKEAQEKGLKDIFNNVRQYLYVRSDSMTVGAGCYHWKTQGINKVGLMERLRDFTGNNGLILRSRDCIDEMKDVTREGDVIKAPGKRKDDRVVALAMGIRCWEQMERRGLIARNMTFDEEAKKKKLNFADQFALLSKHHIDNFFKHKQTVRARDRTETMRNQWRDR